MCVHVRVHMCIYGSVRVCVMCVCACAYARVYIWICECMCVLYVCVRVHTCIYGSVSVCMCVCVCVFACAYVCAHMGGGVLLYTVVNSFDVYVRCVVSGYIPSCCLQFGHTYQ